MFYSFLSFKITKHILKTTAVRKDGHRKRGKEKYPTSKLAKLRQTKNLYSDVKHLHPAVSREIFPREIPPDVTSLIDIITRAHQATSPNFNQITKFCCVSYSSELLFN